MCLLRKNLGHLTEDIQNFAGEAKILLPIKFWRIFESLYNFKKNIEERDYNDTKNFTDEVRDFHPYIKNKLGIPSEDIIFEEFQKRRGKL